MRRMLLSGAILLAMVANPAASQEAYKLCKLVKDDGDRLKCFDAATVESAPEKPGAEIKQGWSVTEERAPIDDSPSVFAVLVHLDSKLAFVMRCQEGVTTAGFAVDGFLGLSDTTQISYRIGDAPAITATWRLAGGKLVVAPIASTIPLLRALSDDQKLFVRISDFKGMSHEALFNLEKVAPIRDKIAAACKWNVVAPVQAKAAAPVPYLNTQKR